MGCGATKSVKIVETSVEPSIPRNRDGEEAHDGPRADHTAMPEVQADSEHGALGEAACESTTPNAPSPRPQGAAEAGAEAVASDATLLPPSDLDRGDDTPHDIVERTAPQVVALHASSDHASGTRRRKSKAPIAAPSMWPFADPPLDCTPGASHQQVRPARAP